MPEATDPGPVSCAARKRWPRGSKASRLDALWIRRTVGSQEEAVRSLVPACAPRGCSASAARGSQASGSSKATKSRGAGSPPPPKRAKWSMRGDLRGVPKAHPGLPTSPFDAVRLPQPAPVVLSNLLTRFSNSSSAGGKENGTRLTVLCWWSICVPSQITAYSAPALASLLRYSSSFHELRP